MSLNPHELPSSRRLLKATAMAIAVAGVLLVTTVLPAEYGIDPTGVGGALGLDAIAASAQAAEPAVPAASAAPSTVPDSGDATLATKAAAAFGKNNGQAFAASAFSPSTAKPRSDALTVTLPPGKGAEVKMQLKSGEGVVFHWSATSDVAVDMHGERVGVKNAWTTYSVEAAQRQNAGTFVAPFEGSHGWYWHNRGTEPVTVDIDVTGFQPQLYQP